METENNASSQELPSSRKARRWIKEWSKNNRKYISHRTSFLEDELASVVKQGKDLTVKLRSLRGSENHTRLRSLLSNKKQDSNAIWRELLILNSSTELCSIEERKMLSMGSHPIIPGSLSLKRSKKTFSVTTKIPFSQNLRC